MRQSRVLIVGAGPVGMVCALALHRQGVPVTVFEQEAAPVKDQRAASLHPSTLALLDELGVAEDIIPRGLISAVYRFHDRVTGRVVAEFDLGRLADELEFPFVLQYEQYKLTADIARHYATTPDFDVRFGHRVAVIEQEADGVALTVEGPDGPQRHAGAWLVGTDGGRSTVRRAAGIAFEGFTYPERFVKIATPFDLGAANPDYAYRNYVSDPEEWCNLFKVRGEDGVPLWRCIFPTGPEESEAEAVSPERVEARLQKLHPQARRYEVAYCAAYGVNQRVAATFRQGRILLAGDSAHVNNPIGGMGMNGGIQDAMNLAGKLAPVLRGEADESLLDRYSRQRRHAAIAFVQAQTIANKKMMEERDPALRRARFDELRRVAEDQDASRAFMRRAAMVESLREAALVD
ncbi:FAD-dependent monooxygenase [Roseomonas sp. NAR14]|uniref:FAD-dependent monooxygenase n=1 Tax=Roseomonas acroporae TaxID=2937791 RepID=A0A9X1YDE8_9PROT|nr:FAD-dependent monooxygenase [Roseomonas acroporae]MCK8787762.1 FAD-dependent monooxygenase [Roseomonas acroporae]